MERLKRLAVSLMICGVAACATHAPSTETFVVPPKVAVPVRNFLHVEYPDIACSTARVSELRYHKNGVLEICDGSGNWRVVTVVSTGERP